MSAHTPTPWIFDGELILPAKIDDGVIARVPNHPENAKGWEANAAFIVKAVNSHESLVKALSELYALVRGECPSLLNEDSGGDARLYLEIKAILAVVASSPTPSAPAASAPVQRPRE